MLIVVGGVLILKRHPHGPACAGLACIFLCFFPLGWMLLVVLAALTTGELVGLLHGLAYTVVLYCVPVGITIWCLRQELAKKEDSEFLD